MSAVQILYTAQLLCAIAAVVLLVISLILPEDDDLPPQ